jgi:hypothetical protein
MKSSKVLNVIIKITSMVNLENKIAEIFQNMEEKTQVTENEKR